MLILFACFTANADEKDPIAEYDFAEAMALQTIEIHVLENDYAYENHPIKINLAFGALHGTLVKNDSTIFYTPNITFRGMDSLSYNIKDLVNNRVSEMAKVYIAVGNDGFAMLDANQVACRINAFGLQYWDLGFGTDDNYEVPAGSGIATIFSETFWLGGYDEAGQLHLAAERYRQDGEDFWAGPVMDSAAYSNETDVKWNKVWKLSSPEIQFHRDHWQDEGYEPIGNIASWPGNGDVNLGQAARLAPYYDWNANDIYDPENGDFPLIKGDLAIYLITNDHRGIHTESGGESLGVEIHTMYYAYDQPDDSALAYTTFCDRKIINRSANTYHDLYAGTFEDFDLGYYVDDYLCCDTILQSAIVFNAYDMDGEGEGAPGEYGLHPPAQAFTCLNYNMDGFVYFNSYGSLPQTVDPGADHEYYKYLTGFWLDSTHFTYGGNGYGGEVPVHHVFTGDPVSGEGWTEENAGNVPGDRRGLIVSGGHELHPGDTLHLENALVFARDYEGDHLTSLALLKIRIQEVRDFYQNALVVENPDAFKYELNLFPNPFTDVLNVEFSPTGQASKISYSVFDILGEKVLVGSIRGEILNTLDFSNLKAGIYFIRFNDGKNILTRKVIREKM